MPNRQSQKTTACWRWPSSGIRAKSKGSKQGSPISKRNSVNPVRAGQRPRLPQQTPATATGPAAPAKRRTISKAGRARIAAAQRARWAAQKKQQAQPAKPAGPAKPKKRKLSAAGLKAIREATKKRWAVYHKAKKAAA
jgi:hypothetical protein